MAVQEPFKEPPMIALGRAAYNEHIRQSFYDHPRLGLRTAQWDELGEKLQSEWVNVALEGLRAYSDMIRENIHARKKSETNQEAGPGCPTSDAGAGRWRDAVPEDCQGTTREPGQRSTEFSWSIPRDQKGKAEARTAVPFSMRGIRLLELRQQDDGLFYVRIEQP